MNGGSSGRAYQNQERVAWRTAGWIACFKPQCIDLPVVAVGGEYTDSAEACSNYSSTVACSLSA